MWLPMTETRRRGACMVVPGLGTSLTCSFSLGWVYRVLSLDRGCSMLMIIIMTTLGRGARNNRSHEMRTVIKGEGRTKGP